MKQVKALISVAVVAMSASVWAAEPAKSQWSLESSEQKCNRWADYDSLQGDKRAEFLKDCLIELRVPDKQEESGGGE